MRTLDYAGFCQPARGVSGDYYDFLPLGPGKLAMIIADVAGKGLSAALLMASLQAYVRSHAPMRGENCAEMAATLNSLLYQSTDSAHFATMFYAVYDDVARALTYVNAGHFPPILVRGSQAAVAVSVTQSAIGARDAFLGDARNPIHSLEADTHPVGLFDSLQPLEQRLELDPGDWVISYSDGLTEAVNLRGEEFGIGRLVETVTSHRESSRSAAHMLDAILVAVRSHTGDTPQSDDLTLIVARVT
jgi:sigma-B regulation protein RsbU (phosphoserine phosphatase)